MLRRTYLGSVASGVGLFGGCLTGAEDGPTPADPTVTGRPSPTRTATASPTETATETATETETSAETETEAEPAPALSIEAANLIWDGGGDDPIRTNRVDASGAGGTVLVGVRASGTLSGDADYVPHVEVRVFEEGGERIDTIRHTYDPRDPLDGSQNAWLSVDTTGYGRGSYEAEVRLTARTREITAGPARFAFELVGQLSGEDVEVREFSPETVTAGEPFDWELTLRNASDRTSSLVGTVLIELGETGTQRRLGKFTWTLPAKSTVTFTRRDVTLREADTYRFRVEPADLTWQVEATEGDEAARLGRTVL